MCMRLCRRLCVCVCVCVCTFSPEMNDILHIVRDWKVEFRFVLVYFDCCFIVYHCRLFFVLVHPEIELFMIMPNMRFPRSIFMLRYSPILGNVSFIATRLD